MGSLANAQVGEESYAPSVAERRALIDRVSASEHFRRSARLRDFLLYVGGQSLKPECGEIHEQEVGAKVFGRSPSYDRSQDNIVRVNATELRKRIDAYFATEGAHERLIVEIPRGSYKPLFRWREPVYEMPVLSAVPSIAVNRIPLEVAGADMAQGRSPRKFSKLVWPVICFALAAACLILLQQNRNLREQPHSWQQEPAVSGLWTEFLRGPRQTDVVLPDASVSVSEEILGKHMSLADYLNHKYSIASTAARVSLDRRADLEAIFGHNLVAFGDFRAAQQVLALDPGGSSVHLTFARFFTADSLKDHNAILIGGKKANPWVRMFDDETNFSLDYDDEHAKGFITNRHPQPGEQSSYSTSMDPNGLVGYTAVADLPNPSHTGKVIVIAGTDSDATSAAAEFLTSEEQLRKLQKTMGIGQFPYFEMLLKTSRLSGTSFNAELIAYRTFHEEAHRSGTAENTP